MELPLDYPERRFLLAGIRDGFRITDTDMPSDKVFLDNYRSCTDPATIDRVEAQICEELANGRYKRCDAPLRSIRR